ncbi:ATP-binding cassette domain-containing protein [Streptomyces sp.]|uniref:ABC transporter ATP-binding protein n=1 Tax=Streptomyces sp. TaxID=1931 RepID=UPI0025D6E23F|nr:ATP-binding cassette domain-containing protein [Streptomyces sp.]
MTALQLTGVTWRREGLEILRGVDLTVQRGEHWALLGRNGCGKTSLLALAGAREHPTTGTVDVLGQRLGRVDVFRELWPRIGAVTGRHRPSGRLTAGQVVLTGLSGTNGLPLRWSPSADDHAAVARSLADVGISSLAYRPWDVLSNGEQRRTLLARALVRAPELLLLDEPAAGLDLPAREHLLASLDGLSVTSVLVTHHVEEIPRTTTHAALMSEGRLLAQGRACEVLTSERMSECFGMSLVVEERDGRFSARTRGGGRPPASS